MELFINSWVVLFISISISVEIRLLVNLASWWCGGWVNGHDFFFNFNFFTSEGELEIVVEWVVFIVSSAAKLLIDGLTSEISWGFFFLDDTIKIAVNGLKGTTFHEASAEESKEAIVICDI